MSSIELLRADSMVLREPNLPRKPPEQRHRPGKDRQNLPVLSVGAIERIAMHPDGLPEALLDPGIVSRRDVLFDLERFGCTVDDGLDELQCILDLKDSEVTMGAPIICVRLDSYLHFLHENQRRMAAGRVRSCTSLQLQFQLTDLNHPT